MGDCPKVTHWMASKAEGVTPVTFVAAKLLYLSTTRCSAEVLAARVSCSLGQLETLASCR